MRKVNSKGQSQSDSMWTNIYSHRDSLNCHADVQPKKVTLVKQNGDRVDVTQAYLNSYS